MFHVHIETAAIKRLAEELRATGRKTDAAYRRAVNRAGDSTRVAMVRELTRQTGLRRAVIVRALKKKIAAPGSLAYAIRSGGGDISLKYFKPRETRAGVTAAPKGARRLYAGVFMKGGMFPKRVAAKGLNGHVYERIGGGRLPLAKIDSGVVIPAEMIVGATQRAFRVTVERELPKRLLHELSRALPKG